MTTPAQIEAAEHILDNAIAYATGTKVTISIKQANQIWSALTAAAQTTTPAQIEADNQKLRSALADMVEITKRNSSPSIILTAIRTCAAHALTVAAQIDDEVSYSENDVKIIIAANIERCAQVAEGFQNKWYDGKEIAAAIRKLKDEP